MFCLLLLAPSAARADWSAPLDVSAPGSSRREARVAVEPSGAAVVAWLARDGAAAVLHHPRAAGGRGRRSRRRRHAVRRPGAGFTHPAPAAAPSAFALPAGPSIADVVVAPCRVPKLKWLTLAKARKRLKRAGCTVGTIERPRGARRKGHRLVVKTARLKPGTGAVKLKLVWRPRAGGA